MCNVENEIFEKFSVFASENVALFYELRVITF